MSKIDPALLLAALDARRTFLGGIRHGSTEKAPLTWVEVAAQTGTHSALFTRLKNGTVPGEENLNRLLGWLGQSEDEFVADDEECTDCPTPCVECGDALASEEADEDEAPASDEDEGEADADDEDDGSAAPADKTAAIIGDGRLSESEDPDTQAAVLRVAELLREGAVAVSIKHDFDPDTTPSEEEIQALVDAEDWDALDELMSTIKARPRHVAVVDTAAFSDARLTLGEDGFSINGPIVFEGMWTGDLRRLPYGGLVWDDELLPIPVIWDRSDGDHTGQVVGYISSLERVDDQTSAVRSAEVSEDDAKAVAAAAGATTDALPAAYFKTWKADGARAMKISAPDARGLRHVTGHVVPNGVCHRSDMGACFQFPGDVSKDMPGFHTGFEITLDDGSSLRPGAITFGGLHVDTTLAGKGVDWRNVNRHREDTNQVFAMVRVWQDAYGLACSGVVMPGVTEDQLLQAQTSAPSVELWPAGRGRTLVGVHIVPTPAWPVAASAGSAQEFVSSETITVEEPPSTELEATVEPAGLDDMRASLARVEQALALLVSAHIAASVEDIPEPVE